MLKNFVPHVLFALLFLAFFIFESKQINKIKFDYEAQEKEIQKLHKEQFEKIAAVRLQEKLELEQNMKNLHDLLILNQKEYEKKLMDLFDKKKRESDIVSKKPAPDLVKDVSEATGIKIYDKGSQ